MSHSIIESSPTPLMRAAEENLLGHVSFVQRRLEGMRVEEQGDVVVVDSGLGSDTFNKVLGARFSEDEAGVRIGEVLASVRGRERPFSWWVGPCSRPLDLETRLHGHGLRVEEHELGMVIELAEAPKSVPRPPGAVIEKVTTPGQLAAAARVLADLFDPPDDDLIRFFDRASGLVLEAASPMRFFIAYVDGEPAAVSELYLGGGLAGVHMVGTAAGFRRRGLGMALTWAALDEGRREGMAFGALQASPEGQPIYERLGFEPCGRFAEYSLGC